MHTAKRTYMLRLHVITITFINVLYQTFCSTEKELDVSHYSHLRLISQHLAGHLMRVIKSD